MNYNEYNNRYKESISLLSDFGSCCRKINQYKIELTNEVFSYLLEKAFDTFLSIQMLVEIFQLSNAHCLCRVLVENVVNFIYLSTHKDKIFDYKSSEMKIMKSLFEKISIDTKHMKEPYKLSRMIDNEISRDYQSAARIAKEYRQLYGQDNWTNISFIDKSTAIGLYTLYVVYKRESSLIHSNWFDKGRNDALGTHYSFSSIVEFSMQIMNHLMFTINEVNDNKIESVLFECVQISEKVKSQLKIMESKIVDNEKN